MIANAKPPRRARKSSVLKFEGLLSTIEREADFAFRPVALARREELIADVVAIAYCDYVRLLQRGRADLIYASPLAHYAIRQVRAGRRVGLKLNVRDITSTHCQRAKRVTLERLDVRDSTGGGWQQVLVEDRRSTPADIAATRIDFRAWLRSLAPNVRRIANILATGETTKETAKNVGLSPGRVSQLRRELQASWQEFQGELAAA